MSNVKIRQVRKQDGSIGYTDQNGNPLVRRVRRDGSCVFFDENNNRVAEMPAGTVDVSKMKAQNQQVQAQQSQPIPQTPVQQTQNQQAVQQEIPKQNPVQQEQITDDDFATEEPTEEQGMQSSVTDDNKSWEQRLREQSANDKEYKKALKEEDKKRFERTKKEFKQFDSVKKKNKTGGGGFKINKKTLIIAASVVGVLLVLIVAKKFLGNKKVTPYSMAKSILSTELGTYTFQYDVASSAIGDTVTTLSNQAQADTLSDAEKMYAEQNTDTAEGQALEEAAESSQEAQLQQSSSTEWDLFTQTADWTYPKYTVLIDGATASVDPFETHFTVNLKTPYANAKFTEVFVKDGKTYIDVGSIKNWLLGSNDAYLSSLASRLPDGLSFVQMDENAMQFYSRYAEDGEKKNSGYVSFRQIYKEKGTEISGIFSAIESAVGKKGLKSDNVNGSVVLEGEDAQTAMSALKSYDNNYLKNYGTIYNGLHEQGIIGDTMLDQAVKESDNRLVAHQGVQTFFLNNKVADMAPVITMKGSKGDVGGVSVLESGIDMQFNADNKTYEVALNMKRTGEKVDIEAPTTGVTPLETIGNLDMVADVVYQVIDYFSISPILGATQLELSPDNILDDMLTKFANMVNNLGTYPIHLTKDNIGQYINEFKGKQPSKAKSEQEANNIKIVASITDSLNKLGFGGTGTVSGDETGYLDNAEQYPTTRGTVNGADYAIKVNANETNGKLLVLDAAFTNGGDTDVEAPTGDEEPAEEEEPQEEGSRKVDFDEEYTHVGELESAAEAQAYIIDVNNGLLTDSEDDIKFIDSLYKCASNKDGSGAYKGLYLDTHPEIVTRGVGLDQIKDDLDSIKEGLESAQETADDTDAEIAEVVETAHNTIHVDVTAFSVKSLLGSIYPINNDIKIIEYDNTFDIESLVKEIDIEPGETVYVKMYCVLGDDDGHLDLYYNNTQVGVAVEY